MHEVCLSLCVNQSVLESSIFLLHKLSLSVYKTTTVSEHQTVNLLCNRDYSIYITNVFFVNSLRNPLCRDHNVLQSLQQLYTAKQKCSQLVDRRFVTSSNRPAGIPHQLRLDYQYRFGMNICSTFLNVFNRRQLHYSVTRIFLFAETVMIPSNGRLTHYNCIGGLIISVLTSSV